MLRGRGWVGEGVGREAGKSLHDTKHEQLMPGQSSIFSPTLGHTTTVS